MSSRSENRQVRNQSRSAEYYRRRQKDNIILGLVTFITFGVPAIYYGAIEYGWVHPPVTWEFQKALVAAGAVMFMLFLGQLSKYSRYMEDDFRDRRLTSQTD